MKLKAGFKRTSPREGNDLLDCGDHYLKSSRDSEKIMSEINFYHQLPTPIASYFPPFLGATETGKWPSGYKITKIEAYDASVYFVYANDEAEREKYFANLFDLLAEFFDVLPKKEVSSDDNLLRFIRLRDQERVSRMDAIPNAAELLDLLRKNSYQSFADFSKTISSRIELLTRNSNTRNEFYSHGDLCLSNIIVENNKLFLIDPKGSKGQIQFQSPYYDFAKLSQCFYGGYDFINHHQNLDGFNPSYTDLFEKLIQRFDLNLRLIRCVEASHFLTMLPLHSEAPQKCYFFLQQALRAFASSHD